MGPAPRANRAAGAGAAIRKARGGGRARQGGVRLRKGCGAVPLAGAAAGKSRPWGHAAGQAAASASGGAGAQSLMLFCLRPSGSWGCRSWRGPGLRPRCRGRPGAATSERPALWGSRSTMCHHCQRRPLKDRCCGKEPCAQRARCQGARGHGRTPAQDPWRGAAPQAATCAHVAGRGCGRAVRYRPEAGGCRLPNAPLAPWGARGAMGPPSSCDLARCAAAIAGGCCVGAGNTWGASSSKAARAGRDTSTRGDGRVSQLV